MSFSTLLSAVLLATSAMATPLITEQGSTAHVTRITSTPISLRTALKINATGGPGALVNRDRKRFQTFWAGQGHAMSNSSSFADVPANDIGPLFTAEIGVGTPPTMYQLIVDTGSSNTFVGANAPYTPTSSSKDTGNTVSVSYGAGEFSGEEFTDTVTLGDLSISDQSIGVAKQAVGFQGLDGILGLGPDSLTTDTVQGEDTVPTVTDNLAAQGKVPSALVGILFPPSTSSNSNGSLDFGATDQSHFTGDITYTPVTQQSPSNLFWGIDQSITYGDGTEILKSTAGIVDTGTTLLYLATDAFQAYMEATGAVQDQQTGLLKVDNTDNLKSLFFEIGGKSFEYTANAQTWPQSLNSVLGGDSGSTYLVVNDIGSPSGQGMDFVNGFTFLQRFYSVFDTTNSQVGFATTSFTNATTN